ncbi:MAG: aminomethyl-transferring glycine dehydrogenase [Flavobacteriales bacterium]|nr:aminomethyl-transferring glycine dehydrogenase [Bacteroidota bacterium]MCB9240114.1 aminomethyl-transferring glycine dehydrogenase [Flavobacteriales bacterium]
MELKIDQIEFFKHRHTSITEAEKAEMLKVVGVGSMEELIAKTIPENIRITNHLDIDAAVSEQKFLSDLREIASENKIYRSYIGMGYYNTYTPTVILRNIIENPGWYTQYTPYQAEIAQGRLEALLNYQTMVMDLTGMDLANASLLDEGTACAEAMHMFHDLCKRKEANKFFVDERIFPQTLDVLKTRSNPVGIELVVGDFNSTPLDESFFGALVQYPDAHGEVRDYAAFTAAAHEMGILVAAAADLLSLTMLTAPGDWGADAVVGNSQRFGVPLGYGGPHAAYFASREDYKRQIPGRIIGVSKDAQGKYALRMALQTREQHIKRDKATSNICTAQVLLAIMAGMYGTYHGPKGLKKIASKIHGLTRVLDAAIQSLGYTQVNKTYFDTLRIEGLSEDVLHSIRNHALKSEINLCYEENWIQISLDETAELSDVQDVANCFAAAIHKQVDCNQFTQNLELNWSSNFVRTSDYMTHEVFSKYHTEHEMLRYLKSLENKDLSLTHSMISLGSCTMKLNATTEMIPVTWPEFNSIHPFVPVDQALGYQTILDDLSRDLAEITGFAGVSLQPNAGSQGEYAGLMVIREYLQDQGQGHRNIALIPSSAHGTNPASAVMAGMQVVVVKCLDNGYIDMDDLRAKAEQHADDLACIMVTYPSTNGVYEETIREITSIVHEHGGQVYMDGANMNAQVGLTNPGMIGADVCHLNLHKTFCIPHGGGGPGMGPICVAAHLKPYLPGHAVVKTGYDKAMHAVSAAPFGSASILLISYAYIKMMGYTGLKEATEAAILNANYIKARLDGHYEMLFKGKNGTVAHEMIVDTRVLKASSGIQVEDIAKRLMDYGFHAPTVSFPIAGTLMVEPTESESKDELDRFIDCLIAIREEIRDIEEGRLSKDDNMLLNAPHTAEVVMSSNWNHAYSRERAAYPLEWVRTRKFWPSVSRVDNTYGDRNLVCACLPLDAYEESAAS